jgi:flagellar hook protein FlgE
MSLYGAMFSGVSGLASQSQAMGQIADNISNVNTVGFKRTQAKFSTLVTQSASETAYSPGGVQSRPFQMVDRQGLLQSSASPTDISVSGNGFFVVNTNSDQTQGTYMFTRAGSFTADKDGYLRNAAGFYLQGEAIPAGAATIPPIPSVVSALETVNILALTNNWEMSTAGSVQANLMSSQTAFGGVYAAGDMAAGTVTPHFARDLLIYDSQGNARTITIAFLKTAANTWQGEIYGDTNGVAGNELIASGTATFNADGSLNTISAGLTSFNIGWAAALGITTPQPMTLDFGTAGQTDGLTQSSGGYQLISSTVDGAVLGNLSGVDIGEDGIITALFDNGTRRPIYRLPVATFRNPNGLDSKTGNAWLATDTSGPYTLKEPNTQGAGKIAPNTLESSTVDLAEEFTNMIITQRAYSASGKIITTADEMLEELIRLKR